MYVGGSGMTHNRAPAVGSGGPTDEKPSKPSGFWRIWEGLPPLIQALTPLIILLVGGAGGVAIGHAATSTPQPTATVTVTATAPPSTSTSISTPAPTGTGASALQSSSVPRVATPLYTAPFTVHGPNAGTCNTWVYVDFSAAGPVVNSGGASALDFDCSSSGVPEVRSGGSAAFAAVPSKPDESTCVNATQRDPLPALALRDMTSGMWLCVDDGSLVTAMQLQTAPSQAATTGVVRFTASSWPA